MFKKALILFQILIAVLVAIVIGGLVFGLVSIANAEEVPRTMPNVVHWTEEEYWMMLETFANDEHWQVIVSETEENLIGVALDIRGFEELIVYSKTLKRGVWISWYTDVDAAIAMLDLIGISNKGLKTNGTIDCTKLLENGELIYFK